MASVTMASTPSPRWKIPRLLWIAAVVALGHVIILRWLLTAPANLPPEQPSHAMIFTYSDGEFLGRSGGYAEAPVQVESLPKYVTDAFVAIEDHRFYQHWGFDLIGMIRALAFNIVHKHAQGASTITQQLVKNADLTPARTLMRKAKELKGALWLEWSLGKKKILSRYLSTVYFGDGVYGLRGAARHYFNKSPAGLTLGESAILAGLVQAPSALAPTEHFDAARRRATLVLKDMVKYHLISAGKTRGALERVHLHVVRTSAGSYITDWLTPRAGLLSNAKDAHLRTTFDPKLQMLAERSVSHVLLDQGRHAHATQAAVVAMRADGTVLALVGGRDHRASSFDRATQAERQPGSTFKIAVALAALRSGMTPDSTVTDAPITINGWSPKNFDGSFAGEITLRRAFAESRNAAFVWLAEKVGLANVAQAASDLGIAIDSQLTPSMALGTKETTLMALTSAYARVQGGCLSIVPYGINSEVRSADCQNRLSDSERNMMIDLLKAVVSQGTGVAAHVISDAAGKTGTTSDYRDAWFIGFNKDVVIGVWLGNDDHSPMNKVTGGGLPAAIWVDVMTHYIAANKPKIAQAH